MTARSLLKFADAAKSMLEEALNCEPFTRSDEASERVPAPDPAAPWADDFGADHGKGAA